MQKLEETLKMVAEREKRGYYDMMTRKLGGDSG